MLPFFLICMVMQIYIHFMNIRLLFFNFLKNLNLLILREYTSGEGTERERDRERESQGGFTPLVQGQCEA